MSIDEEKSSDFDFPIEINDDFFIDYYRFLSIFIYFVKW